MRPHLDNFLPGLTGEIPSEASAQVEGVADPQLAVCSIVAPKRTKKQIAL